MTAGTVTPGDIDDSVCPRQSERTYEERTSSPPISSNREEVYSIPPLPTNSWINVDVKESVLPRPSNGQDVVNSTDIVKGSMPIKLLPPIGHKGVQPLIVLPDPRGITNKDMRFGEGSSYFPSKSSGELAFDVEDLNIPWSDLALKEKIGEGMVCLLSNIALDKL